jgi:hypothetical protein
MADKKVVTRETGKGHNDKRIVITLFLGSLLIRVLYVAFFNVNRLSHGQDIFRLRHDDQGTYWQFAEAILQGGSWLTSHVSFRPPLYPLFLALISAVIGPGRNFLHIMLVQCIVGSFSVILIYFLARAVFSGKTAVMSASWAAAYPLFLYYCGFLLGETVVTFLFLWFILALTIFLKRGGLRVMAASGVLYALLIHADPRFLFHFPFVFLYLYLGLADLKKAVRPFLVFSLTALLCSAPWAVRNHIAYPDRFVLIDTRTLDVWAKRTADTVSGKAMHRRGTAATVKPHSIGEFEKQKGEALEGHGPRTEEERTAFENGARPSFSLPLIYLDRFLEFWRFARFTPDYDPYPDLRFEREWGLGRNLIGIAFTGVLYPFFAAGIYFCLKRKDRIGLVLCAVISSHVLLHMIVHSRERYRLPVEGLVLIIAFYGLWETLSMFKMNTKSARRRGAIQG